MTFGAARVIDWWALCALGLPMAVAAQCTRTFEVPISSIGISVIVDGDKVSGIYPELLHTITAKTGCQFKLAVVPRARLEAMFENGKADLLMPVTSTARRDRFGVFVPMIDTRATLISIDSKRAPVANLDALLARRELRVAVVRGNDYGDVYQSLVKQLAAQGRLFMEVDPLTVARLLRDGVADVTIMTPLSFAGAIKDDARVKDMIDKLRVEPLPELPWHESGVYVSRSSVSAAERAMLIEMLRSAYKANEVWETFKRTYPERLITPSARPR